MFRLRRGAVTLVELLVVIGLVAILAGLSVIAVVRAREAGVRAESSNNLKQIILAVHHYADQNAGRLPTVGDVLADQSNPDIIFLNVPEIALFVQILPFIDQGNMLPQGGYSPVSLYVSPADPSAQIAIANGYAVSSYASNAQVFGRDPRLPGTFADGTSNTIAFAEHYAQCGETTFFYWRSSFPHRAAFADRGDVIPVTTGQPPVSGDPNFPSFTYQVAPPVSQCFAYLAQTPHPSGMLVAMADGSVRQISPNISPATFWAAVTPAASDSLGADW